MFEYVHETEKKIEKYKEIKRPTGAAAHDCSACFRKT